MNSPCLFLMRLGVDDLDMARRPTRREIALEVAARHGLTIEELAGPEVHYRFAHPRQEAMWRMAQHGYNRGEIGRTLNRTTWTVQHGCQAHAARQAVSA